MAALLAVQLMTCLAPEINISGVEMHVLEMGWDQSWQ